MIFVLNAWMAKPCQEGLKILSGHYRAKFRYGTTACRQVDMLYWSKNRIIIIIIIDFVGRFDPPDEERGICVRTDWAELIVTTPKQITAPAMTRCLPRRNDGTGGWRPNELTLLRSGIKWTGCEIRVIY